MKKVDSITEERMERRILPMVQHKVLFVDDEVNALSSFKRLFFNSNDIEVLTAKNSGEALNVLNCNDVDVVVSDVRMPHLSGSDFLKYIKDKYPSVLRILITAYADIPTTIDAINRGEVYRFLTKPWNDDDLKTTIRKALEYVELKKRNEELSKVLWSKNRELNILNKNLEREVKKRTAQIQKINSRLIKMNNVLKQNFEEVVVLLTGIVSLLNKELSAHSKRVAGLCRALCKEIGLDDDELKTITNAAFLHDIGLAGASAHIFTEDLEELDENSKNFYLYHPVLGEKLIGSVKTMHNIAEIVRSHHEEFNGTGFPKKLRGTHIPLGAQIIKITSDYDNFMFKKGLSSEGALNKIRDGSYKSYDAHLIHSFAKTVTKRSIPVHCPIRRVMVRDLQIGMYLIDDIVLENGVLLIPGGIIIDEILKKKLTTFTSLLRLDRIVEIKYPNES